jgi:3-carboxy-cis,cis-muconate cycloisomerase
MAFAALDSELTGPLFATDEMRAAFSDREKVAAYLKAEAALAEAEARHGLVPAALAAAIRKLTPDDFELAEIGAKTADAGAPTIPFIKAAEAKLPEKLRGSFHKGATSQDIIDTGLALAMRSAMDLISSDIAAIMDRLSAQAKRHRRTPQVGRSFGQHAAPITFGYTAAVWLAGVADAASELPALRRRALAASLGGPVGTLTGMGAVAAEVSRDYAAILGLAEADIAWHTARGRVVAVGAWLVALIGALAKIATDVVFLSSTEVAEVNEAPASGRGGSSAMPHKQNPVSAMVILAAHTAAGGHLAALTAAMAAGQQRPAGAWQSEWHSLPPLFGLASGALREAKRIASSLVMHPDRMRANLDLTRGLLFADAVSSRLAARLGRDGAHKIVEAAAASVRDTGQTFAAVLAGNPAIPASLQNEIASAFDLTPAIDAAAAQADRAIAAAKVARRGLKPGKAA